MNRVLFILPILLLLYGCPKKDNYDYYTSYLPTYMTRSTLESSVAFQEPQELEQPGKIYYHNNRIYINELYEGVHVIENSDPSNPKNINFISAIGCVDIAVKENIIYLDNAVDLIAIDLTTEKVVKRLTNVFPEIVPPDSHGIPSSFVDPDRIIVSWYLPN